MREAVNVPFKRQVKSSQAKSCFFLRDAPRDAEALLQMPLEVDMARGELKGTTSLHLNERDVTAVAAGSLNSSVL